MHQTFHRHLSVHASTKAKSLPRRCALDFPRPMITYLKVRNLAIVEEFAIEPGAGLNVLTGETGAGKSLLIDSLEFLRGARGSTEMIRAGAEKMTAEAVFQLPARSRDALDEIGVDVDARTARRADRQARDRHERPRARARSTARRSSVRELGAAMDAVLEIHGQHESHQRVAGQGYRELLDEYGGHGALARRDARRVSRRGSEAADQLRELTDAQRDRTLRLDLLRYQIDEISAAKLDPAEEESLRGERSMLANARELAEATSGAFALVDDDESSALAQLARALHLCSRWRARSPTSATIAAELQDAHLSPAGDVARTLAHSERVRAPRSGAARRDRGPPRHDRAAEEKVRRLASKPCSRTSARSRTSSSGSATTRRASTSCSASRSSASRRGARRREELSAARKKAAKEFESAIQSELNDLAMERTTVQSRRRCRRAGARARRRARHRPHRDPHRAEPRRGAEADAAHRLGRRAVAHPARHRRGAVQGVVTRPRRRRWCSTRSTPASAGAWPRSSAGSCRSSRRGNQVICVTHLPQIASFGTTHFFVWKEDAGGHTRARIRRLDDEDERVERGGADARRRIDPGLGGAARARAARRRARADREGAAMKRWRVDGDPPMTCSTRSRTCSARGGVVLLPTDTIYGLHAVADERATRSAAHRGDEGARRRQAVRRHRRRRSSSSRTSASTIPERAPETSGPRR